MTLQIIGLVKSSQAVAASKSPPLVSWCSPIFQPFGTAAVDRDCHTYTVERRGNMGVGCIQLPGVWQRTWLVGTVVGLALELAVEAVDALILVLVNGKTRWREVKMKRPWTSIFAGVVVLFITLNCGISYATNPPPGITQQVTVAMVEPGPASFSGTLTTAGLRGTIIGWNDGVFSSWHDTYYGNGYV